MLTSRHMKILFLMIVCTISHSLLAREPVTSMLEMRQRHVTIQNWDLSCGAAALTTLLNYQHNWDFTEKAVALEMIGRQEYIDDPSLLEMKQGFSLLDLKRFVDKRGLIGNGYGELKFDNLIDIAPVIVPVNLDGYNHFVIFRGIVANRVLLADPAWGNRTMYKDKFVRAWIDFGDIGHVGFTIESNDYEPELNRLKPQELDFAIIR